MYEQASTEDGWYVGIPALFGITGHPFGRDSIATVLFLVADFWYRLPGIGGWASDPPGETFPNRTRLRSNP